MFVTERMRKLTVIGPQTVIDKAVQELHRLKAVHISDHRKDENLDIGSPFGRASRLSALLITLRAVSTALGVSGTKKLSNGFRAVGVKNLSELEKAAKKLNKEVSSIASERKGAEDELKKLASREEQVLLLKGLGLSPSALSESGAISYFIGTVKDAKRAQSAVSALTEKFEMASSEGKGGDIVAVFVESAKKSETAEALSKAGFSEVQLNDLKGIEGTTDTALDSIRKRKDRLKRQVEAGAIALARLAKKWNDFLLLGEQLISEELDKAEAPLRMAVSRKFFVLRGWVPSAQMKNLEASLSKATGEKIFVDSELPHHGDSVPVQMANPKPAKPFEFFMKLYALPKYDEIDPTVFMFITFPLFFGFIMGDVGYGLVTFFLLLWLKEKFGPSAKLINLMIPAAISSITFGFIFGEVFGFEQAFGFEFPRLLTRYHEGHANVVPLMAISVGVGILHLNTGFILGFINELHHKGLFKAFAAKLCWITLQIGALLGYLSMSHRIGMPAYLGWGLASISVVLIAYGEGLKAVEIMGLPSNILSYTRLMAVGLSSAILAVVINDLSRQIAGSGTIGMIASVLLLFLGHTLNLVLGLLGGFLHSLRLHYVEFFTKFFEGGAIPFKPFGSKGEDN